MKLAYEIKKICLERGLTLSAAESCTGGYISHLITSVPGSSNYFKGCVVAYWEEIKVKVLGVPRDIVNRFSVFSPQVAMEMAKGAAKLFGTDIAVSSTGIAGPTGGTKLKPVGTVYLGFLTPEGTFSKILKLEGERNDIIKEASKKALETLLELLGGREIPDDDTEQALEPGGGKVP